LRNTSKIAATISKKFSKIYEMGQQARQYK